MPPIDNKSFPSNLFGRISAWQLFIATCFLIVLGYRFTLVFFPSPNSGGSENAVLYFAQRLIAGETLYTDPAQPPYAIAQYTPLYYYLLAFLSKLFSIRDFDILELFKLNRSIGIVLDLATCFLVAQMLKRLYNVSRAVAYSAAMIAFVFIAPWSRTDNLSIFFWMAALYSFLSFLVLSQRPRYFLLAILFSVLSVLSKQSGLTIVIIITLWLAVTGRLKGAIVFSVLFCLLLFALLMLFINDSSSNDFYGNTVLGVNNGFSFRDYQSLFVQHYITVGLVSLVCFVIAIWLLAKEKSPGLRFLAFTLVVQFILFNLLALKIGSGLNYLTEWLILVIMTLAVYARRLEEMLSPIRPNAAAVIVCIVIGAKAFTCIPLIRFYGAATNFQVAEKRFEKEKSVAQYVTSHLKMENEYVMTDLRSPSSYFSNLLRTKLLFPQSDVTNSVYTRNVYDLSRFKSQADNRSVRYFILQKPAEAFNYFDVNFVKLNKDTVIGDLIIYRLN